MAWHLRLQLDRTGYGRNCDAGLVATTGFPKEPPILSIPFGIHAIKCQAPTPHCHYCRVSAS